MIDALTIVNQAGCAVGLCGMTMVNGKSILIAANKVKLKAT